MINKMIIHWSYSLFMLITLLTKSVSSNVLNEGPCNFMDTVNITDGGWIDHNGDYHFSDVLFKRGTFAEYDYILENITNKIPVDPHYRGCICEYKPCIRICCMHVNDENRNYCVLSDTLVNIPIEDGEEKNISLKTDEFGVLQGKPCSEMFKLEPLDYEYDKWIFLKVINDCLFIQNHKTCN